MQRLSEHDKAVLNSIFNPLLPLGEGCDFSDDLNSDISSQDEDLDSEKLAPEIVDIQKRAILETEAKNYDVALKLFEEALERSPKSPVILNDRAQCLRLAGLNDEAMKDLNLALDLSKGRGKAGVRALCQRGILFRISGKLEEARDDFSEAAKNGSKFAKTQLVELNPYAAMCNQMLKQMTAKLSSP